MEQKGMTARVCAFSRAYHREHNKVRIFDDTIAKRMLAEEEYKTIADNMANGIAYFNKEFQGSKEEALRFVVDHVLSQTPLARAAFAEEALKEAVENGATQYMICAAGYDTFAYRQPDWAKGIPVFEIDYPGCGGEKQERLKKAGIEIPDNVHYIEADFSKSHWEEAVKQAGAYKKDAVSFCSLLGMIYYLSKQEFDYFLAAISVLIPANSSIVFDYPNEEYFKVQKKHKELADASKEGMQACYSYEKMKAILEKYHFAITRHLDSKEMTNQYFSAYNKANPRYPMTAQENVNYCVAVKTE